MTIYYFFTISLLKREGMKVLYIDVSSYVGTVVDSLPIIWNNFFALALWPVPKYFMQVEKLALQHEYFLWFLEQLWNLNLKHLYNIVDLIFSIFIFCSPHVVICFIWPIDL